MHFLDSLQAIWFCFLYRYCLYEHEIKDINLSKDVIMRDVENHTHHSLRLCLVSKRALSCIIKCLKHAPIPTFPLQICPPDSEHSYKSASVWAWFFINLWDCTWRCVRAMIVSMTGPLSSFSKWTSSMMSSFTVAATATSPPFLVITSHFSGVVTIIWVSAISRLLNCMSPVNSFTSTPAQIHTLFPFYLSSNLSILVWLKNEISVKFLWDDLSSTSISIHDC